MAVKELAIYLTSVFSIDPVMMRNLPQTAIEETAQNYLARGIADQIIERNDQLPILLEKTGPGPTSSYGEIKLTLMVIDPNEYSRLKRIEYYAQRVRMLDEQGPATIPEIVSREMKKRTGGDSNNNMG